MHTFNHRKLHIDRHVWRELDGRSSNPGSDAFGTGVGYPPTFTGRRLLDSNLQ